MAKRKPLLAHEQEISYEFTTDPALEQQFLELRRHVFSLSEVTKKILEPNQGCAYKDVEHHLLVARDGDTVIGGVLIYVNRAEPNKLLPLESENFRLQELFPEYELDKKNCCQVSYFVIHPKYRGKEILVEMLRHGYIKFIEWGISHMFSVTPTLQSRRYIQSASNLGLPIIAHPDKETPLKNSYNGYKRILVEVRVIQDLYHDLQNNDYLYTGA